MTATDERRGAAVLFGAGAMVCVGSSVAVSKVLAGGELFTAQAVRYALASLGLIILARAARRGVVLPRGTEWLWFLGVAATGLVTFNVALVEGSRHAEPAVIGVAVACVPLILAVVGPLLEGQRPRRVVITAAIVVTAGAALVEGGGRCDAVGLAWAVVVLGCEAAFTLLAVPVLRRHGAWGVSVHTTWMAAVIFGVLGLVVEGPAAVTRLSGRQVAAIGYLAVAVTVVAFLLWYSCVRRLGAGHAGLLAGLAPVAAAVSGIVIGRPAPAVLVWVGIAVVVAGLGIGLLPSGADRRRSPAHGAPAAVSAPSDTMAG